MKGREVERLARRHLLPVLPSFLARGALVYRPPAGYLLQAVLFDTSDFTSSRIFVTAFVQPLLGPYEHLTLSYGFRLGRDSWDVNEDDPDDTFAAIAIEVQRDAVPFFAQAADLDRFCDLIPQWANERPRKVMRSHSVDDPVIVEDLAYAAIVRGDGDAAASLLRDAITLETENGEYRDDSRITELRRMLEILEEQGLDPVHAQLDEWRKRTIASLKL